MSPRNAHAILLRAGFLWRPGKGDHRLYVDARLSVRVGLDWRDPLLPAYVKQIIRAIETVLDAEDDLKEREK